MMSRKQMRTILRVGDGRGFVVQGLQDFDTDRLVVTAAHCLPHLPPPHGAAYLSERTYKDLLGPLDAEPSVWCECLFVDSVADIAVLGSPDNQALSDEADKYEALMETAKCFTIAAPPSKPIPNELLDKSELSEEMRDYFTDYECPAFLYALDGEPIPCVVQHRSWGSLLIKEAKIVGGMSGSPIVDAAGNAIGMACLGVDGSDHGMGEGPNPLLVNHLPGWLVAHAEVRQKRRK